METRDILSRCSLFSTLEASALEQLAEHCSVVSISGGELLYEPGEKAETMYIVVAGRLGASLRDKGPLLQIGRLEAVGEIGMVSGDKRSARVHALRDTLLLCIHRDDFLAFVQQYPSALMTVSRDIIHRLSNADQKLQRRRLRQHRAYAVVPAHRGIDNEGFARQLAQSLGELERTVCVDANWVDTNLGPGISHTANTRSADNERLVAWLNNLESKTAEGYLIYIANHAADAWTQRCLRQVDRILIVAQAGDPPVLTATVNQTLNLAAETPIDLVFLRPPEQAAGDVMAWRQRLRTANHYFVVPQSGRDVDSLARQLTGRGLGLVLGGGGARGFAHLGLLRALKELELPIDLAGGSSMGALLAGLYATGMDHQQVREIARDTFVTKHYLNDYQLPRVSLIRGRKLLNHLREVLGTQRIEDLRKPFFCVSTNLTRGEASVHDNGELALWVGTSMAIPGIVPPVAWKGELHADGSVINSLPTDVMQSYNRGPIIASDVGTEGVIAAPGIEGPDPEALLKPQGLKEKVSLFDILFRTASLTSESGVKARAERADCYLRMPVENIGMFDWKQLDNAAETGYTHAMQQLEPMLDVLLCRTEADEESHVAQDVL